MPELSRNLFSALLFTGIVCFVLIMFLFNKDEDGKLKTLQDSVKSHVKVNDQAEKKQKLKKQPVFGDFPVKTSPDNQSSESIKGSESTETDSISPFPEPYPEVIKKEKKNREKKDFFLVAFDINNDGKKDIIVFETEKRHVSQILLVSGENGLKENYTANAPEYLIRYLSLAHETGTAEGAGEVIDEKGKRHEILFLKGETGKREEK